MTSRRRNRSASLRDMPVLYEFNDHPLQPRFTMHQRGELTVSVQVGSRRQRAGTIKHAGGEFVFTPPLVPRAGIDEWGQYELLALGRSIYQTLLTKYEAKRQ